MTGFAHHACGQAVAHRGFDLATRDADVAEHTIVEPVELAHSPAQPVLSGTAARPARTRRASTRSQCANARMVLRMQAWMMRLRMIRAC